MNHLNSILFLVLILSFASCSEKKHTNDHASHAHSVETSENTRVDSLKKTVLTVHDSVMPKMDIIMSLRMRTQKEIKQLDSLSKVNPGQVNAPQREQLGNLLQELDRADEAMMQWMQQFDSQMKDKTDAQKIVYLKNEKARIDSVRTQMLESIGKGQQLLKK